MGKATARTEPAATVSPQRLGVDNNRGRSVRRGTRGRRDTLAEPLDVTIRPALARDRERLGELCIQNEQVHARLLPDYFRVSPAVSAHPAPVGPCAIVLVAETVQTAPVKPAPGPRVVGYVSLKVADTPRDPSMIPRRRAYVETIVVEDEHRERGVGSALMRVATEWARQHDATEMVLTVWNENGPAESLYERLGYHPIARVLRRTI